MRCVSGLLEAVAGIPDQMADAGEEVEDQRQRPAEQQQHADRRAEEPLARWRTPSSEVAAATSHQVSSSVPTASPTPVTRCEIDSAMLIGQR